MRPGVVVVLTLFAATSCGFDRERPSPVEPDAQASLSVQVLAPRPGTVLGIGTDVTIEVSARDLTGDLLVGIGYVARRSGSGGNATLDSATFVTGGGSLATHEFTLHVPETLFENAQIDVFGIAFGPGTQSRLSEARSVTVVECAPTVPGC